MKRFALLALAATLVFTLSVATVSGASEMPPDDPFLGLWKSRDVVDGSRQMLAILPGTGPGQYLVILYDRGASACGCDDKGDPLYAALAVGMGSAEGNELQADLGVWCLTRPMTFLGPSAATFEYDAATDTLLDAWGSRWRRAGRRVAV
jgi:hypothetical protein